MPKPEHEMGPALPSELHKKQQKGQSCTLSPAQRGGSTNLSKIFSHSSVGEGKPKDQSLSRDLFLCREGKSSSLIGRGNVGWGSSSARSAENSSMGWGSSGSPGSHSHQNPAEPSRTHPNPPEPTRTQLLWKRPEPPQLPPRATPTSSTQGADLTSNVQFQEAGAESENPRMVWAVKGP